MSRAQLTSTVEQNTGGAVAPFVAGKNMLVNGGFDNWQRGTTFTGFGTGVYTADRWFAVSNTATYTVTQMAATSTEPVGSNYFARIQATVAGTFDFTLCQPLESAIFNAAKGQDMTISFYARSSTNSSLSIYLNRNTSEGKVFYYQGTTIATRFITANSSWVKYTVSVPAVPKSNTDQGLTLNFQTSSGLGSIIDIFGVQMEFGNQSTPFSRAGGTLSGELQACQRYFYIKNGANGASGTSEMIGLGTFYNSTIFRCPLQFPVQMRTAPSFVSANSANYFQILGNSTNNQYSTVTLDYSTPTACDLNVTVSGATGGQSAWLQTNSGSAFLQFSAEL